MKLLYELGITDSRIKTLESAFTLSCVAFLEVRSFGFSLTIHMSH